MVKNDIDTPLYTIDDDAPLYQIDDDPVSPRVSGTPYDDVDDDDDDDKEDEVEEATDSTDEAAADTVRKKEVSPLKLMFRTMLTPVEGWKALKRARLKPERFAERCFYPLIALAALSEGSSLFYEANISFADWAKNGLSTFITFFFGYFSILMVGGSVLPKKSREFIHKDIGKEFVMLTLSTMALFWSVIQIIPMLEPVLVFLPLWTIYLIFKGVRVLRIPPEVQNSTTGWLCLLIIGAPLFWNWLMTEFILPNT